MAFGKTSSENWFHSINHPNPSSRLISSGNRHRQRSSCKLRKKMLKFECIFLLLLCCWYRKIGEDKLNFIYLYFLCLTITFYLIFFNDYWHYFSFEIWLNQFIGINFDRRRLYTMNLKLNLNIKYRCTNFVCLLMVYKWYVKITAVESTFRIWVSRN